MRKFVGRKIEVETVANSTDPVAVIYRGRRWKVAAIEKTWFDTSHGATPVDARSWRTRRHRKNYVILTESGARLTLYLDYQRPDDRVWHLVTIEEPDR